MDKTSTTPADNPTNDDAVADSTTVTDPKAGTDNQPAADANKGKDGENLDPSKSDDTTVTDGDKTPAADSNKDDTPASPLKLDDDLDDWAEKRKMPKADTDEQKQAYQELRNSQRDFTREQQAKKEAADAKALGDELTGIKPDDPTVDDDDLDPLEKRQNDLEAKYEAERNTRLQSEFYSDNNVTTEEHKAILDLIKEKVNRPATPEGKKSAFDYWASPDALPDLLDLAKAKILKAVDPSVAAEEAAQKEREKIARESEAKSPGRSATTPTKIEDKSLGEERTEQLKARYSSK